MKNNRWLYMCAYLLVAILVNWLSNIIESDFILKFPGAEFITLLVTVFAINVATTNFIISKINELKTDEAPFTRSTTALNNSMIIQVALIVFSFVLLILRASKKIEGLDDNIKTTCNSILSVLMTFVLFYSISILWDTGRTLFLISNVKTPSNGKK